MEIKSLQNLKKNGGVYDLYAEIIVNNNPYAVFKFPCTNRHNMRIDLVCYDIYNNTSSIDVLCTVNSILNPLTIQDGDILFYVDEKDLDAVRSDATVIAAIVDAVKSANKGKQQKTDVNKAADDIKRKETEKTKNYVPPNILQTNNTNIDLGEGTIILKPNF
jgi:hypothetical protein